MTTARHHRTGLPPAGSRRLLEGWLESRRAAGFAEHQARYGPAPVEFYADRNGRARLLAAVDASGLRGRGGAGFPTGRKLRAVAKGRRPVVVANGCEGEPVSSKDHALLTVAPHLVLDGAVLAATAIDATEVILCVHRDDPIAGTVAAAVAERPSGEIPIRLVQVPGRYVASEESALVNFLDNGDARPTAKPPRPFERGVNGRPTLIDNVETLAHLALIARYGSEWFRGCGTAESPGSTLVTLGGRVARPGVYEVALGTPVAEVLDRAGGPDEPPQAVLFGGYGGTWLPVQSAVRTRLSHEDLRDAGATLGVASLTVLPARACGLAETARVLRYLAGESARQCGPCMFGLPAIADDFTALVLGGRAAQQAEQRLRYRLSIIPGRGACAHPDGAVRLAASALRCFGTDLRAHLAGRPCAWAAQPALPLPGWDRRGGDWA
ncbi:NADH-ubiquinone oxidoreductase-F iron-sulfur binding region domain-containing protein [Amycolatopsis benzoatilytica]|uniref:NADH-ubiquinone oxidoreductase-F iron-sulfur binding region domain-containing protein n=1 Tax=Amycolatopsis benzoatilytica TaxID=346045 RepID=UPI00037DABF9|nr:NADH-ubiquinone oxidoreductase-F iron-sulfur binding region domain-containing protein [Amycolatopsis benzoatilytica]